MRIASWDEYELIDASSGERLEKWGEKILIRPDPQIIWNTSKNDFRWNKADAHYYRSKSGGGSWNDSNSIVSPWEINYKDLKFKINIFNFKHTGIFPEQAINWDFCENVISSLSQNIDVLNLFAYTGGATLSCSKCGAKVCHVDSSKGMVNWARENARLSNLSNSDIRWIVDDCVKFVSREKRRGNKYHGVIMDPPSFGRGPNGEIWKIEENLYDFIVLCESIMAEESVFFILNSYTTGLSPSTIDYMMNDILVKKRGGRVFSDEIGLTVTSSQLVLPSGATSIWTCN